MSVDKSKLINADKSRSNQYYLDGHYYQYDLGWMVDTIKELIDSVNSLFENEIVHYADPIQWDITAQYTKNTVVVDPQTGTAYISKDNVPKGILLDNENYWLPIFNYDGELDNIRSSIGLTFPTDIATVEIPKGHFVWQGGKLYRAMDTIPENTQLKPSVNIVRINVDEAIDSWLAESVDWTFSKTDLSLGESSVQAKLLTLSLLTKLTITASNFEKHVTGDDSGTAGDYTRVADDMLLSADNLHLQSTGTPLQYGTPSNDYPAYGTLTMTSETGSTYKLMVERPNSPKGYDHCIIVVGDSYSTSTQSGTPLWWTYLGYGNNVITHAEDGMGFLTGGNTFLNQINTCAGEVGNRIVDHIYCVGGLNDLGNLAITNMYNFSTAVRTFIDRARALFPGVPITMGGVPPFQNYNYYSGNACLTDGQRADNFNLFFEYACSNAGVHYVNLRYLGLFTPEFFGAANSSGQKHPSAAGEASLAATMMGSPIYVNGVTFPALIPTVDNNCTLGSLAIIERNPRTISISFTVSTSTATAFNIRWNGFPRPGKYLLAYDGTTGAVAGATQYDQGVTNFFTVKTGSTYYFYYEVSV